MNARVRRAIDFAYERGVIVCAAAGNVISEVIYPGRFNRVVTVGGLTTYETADLGHAVAFNRGAAAGCRALPQDTFPDSRYCSTKFRTALD